MVRCYHADALTLQAKVKFVFVFYYLKFPFDLVFDLVPSFFDLLVLLEAGAPVGLVGLDVP